MDSTDNSPEHCPGCSFFPRGLGQRAGKSNGQGKTWGIHTDISLPSLPNLLLTLQPSAQQVPMERGPKPSYYFILYTWSSALLLLCSPIQDEWTSLSRRLRTGTCDILLAIWQPSGAVQHCQDTDPLQRWGGVRATCLLCTALIPVTACIPGHKAGTDS